MKRVLLTTAALAALAAVPAKADEPALQLGLGGYISGYGVYADVDDPTGAGDVDGTSYRKFDLRKDTEVHLSGEVTLDNGITAGAHMEILNDRNDAGVVEESYLYLSSNWGRINVGEEDGAAYLIQVAPPTADDKVDGPRPDISAFGYDVDGTGVINPISMALSYAQDPFGYTNKLTYITPVFNGFQAAASYVPTIGAVRTPLTGMAGGLLGIANLGTDLGGTAATETDNDTDDFENGWELAGRYEGSFDAIDIAVGGGYSRASLEHEDLTTVLFDDDFKMWNAGLNVGYGDFGFGVAYLSTNNGIADNWDFDAVVAGVDYVTGPYKLGLSYMDGKQEQGVDPVTGANLADMDIERWTAGVVYEWGPGMTFRGAVQYQENEDILGDTDEDFEGTQVTLGTQLNF